MEIRHIAGFVAASETFAPSRFTLRRVPKAEFSDSAHLTRTCKRMFGIPASHRVDWLDTYYEVHFAVMRDLFKTPERLTLRSASTSGFIRKAKVARQSASSSASTGPLNLLAWTRLESFGAQWPSTTSRVGNLPPQQPSPKTLSLSPKATGSTRLTSTAFSA